MTPTARAGRKEEKMTKTKDQQAQEYVLNRQTARHNAKTKEEATMADFDKTRKVWDAYDMEQAFEDGYTASEQSMWRSVEEELPSNDDKVFVIIRGAYVCGWYDHKYESWEIFGMGSYNRKDASYWMPIPPIHDTNTK